MKLKFCNIGRFSSDTEIEFNGITVVAGKNGLGKSTISKLMFCMFDSFYQIDEQIRRERERAISRNVNGFARWDRQNMSGKGIKVLSQQLLDDYEDGFTVDNVKKIFAACGYNSDFIGDQEYEIILKVLKDISNVSDDEVKNNILKARFMAEFGGQIKNVNYNSNEASIELFVRDKKIKVDINGSVKIASGVSLIKDIVYLDDLSVVDNFRVHFLSNGYSHETNLKSKMFSVNKSRDSIVGDIISSEHYSKIVEKMTALNIGHLEKSNDSNDVVYVEEGLSQAIRLENISAGTKVFLVFKQLIENGYIEEDGMMVLDEPEVHLHPEWQQILAEMIILMQKELNLNVLISSHSADFILFLDYYSKIHNNSDKCKYYSLEEGITQGTTIAIDATDNKDVIFESLGKPFIRVNEAMWTDET